MPRSLLSTVDPLAEQVQDASLQRQRLCRRRVNRGWCGLWCRGLRCSGACAQCVGLSLNTPQHRHLMDKIPGIADMQRKFLA